MSELDRRRASIVVHAVENQIEFHATNLPPRRVRTRQEGSLFVGLHSGVYYVGFQSHRGMPSVTWTYLESGVPINVEAFQGFLYDYLLFDDPVVFSFSGHLADVTPSELVRSADEIAREIISRELNRSIATMPVSQFNPIFGENRYRVQDNLVFVLMPFEVELTEIYRHVIQPTIERELGLRCRRADDISSNRSVIEDIWQSICEARIILADLTGFNPNVMYELGIAHTVGRDSILIYQQGSAEAKFPFDLAHIRRINYTNNVIGADRLKADLISTIRSVRSLAAP